MTSPVAGSRTLLALAAAAVAFAAADTYVVVLALPAMMEHVGVGTNELQKAAPIISGFLLGYVATLPLIGRIADLRGRVPVLVASLTVFALGSLVTAVCYDMPSMVAGRFLQGVGGGGLVPATLALVADLYPADRRGVPLGIVSGVQELGSVLGPLFGALVLAFADWEAIFAINLAVGLVLAVAIRTLGATSLAPTSRRGLPDPLGLLLLTVALGAGVLCAVQPDALRRDLTWGQIFIAYAGDSRWFTPVGVTAIGALVLLVARTALARRPLVDLRSWWSSLRAADLVGALWLAAALSCVVLAFATTDPSVQQFNSNAAWYLAGFVVTSLGFVVHLRRSSAPLIPRGAVAEVPAYGALLVSFFVGCALIAALIDIPVYARTTIYRESEHSQLLAALVLVRFLVALPVGAVLGGFLTRHLPAGVITLGAMGLSAVGFLWMAQWGETSLRDATATVPLVLCGLGFGLALAPVNAALLASTSDAVHGVASALVVVARMVGMLVGISCLTWFGLREFSQAKAAGQSTVEAALVQEHTIFYGAAGCAVIAGALALALFRGARTRALSTGDLLRSSG